MKSFAIDTTNGMLRLRCSSVSAPFFALQSLDLEIGTAFRMGPGYFPLFLAGVLILLGIVILVQATRVEGEPIGPIAWRGMLFILPAPIFFGLTVRGLGFVPSIFLAALIAAFASARMKPPPRSCSPSALTLFSIARLQLRASACRSAASAPGCRF